MPPKFDANIAHTLVIKVVAGEPGIASVLGQKAPKKVADEIANKTKNLRGCKVTVQLVIQNRQATVTVVQTASSLILEALKEQPRDRKKVKNVKHNGNITMNDLLSIARKMREKSFSKELKGTVKEILGTCQAIGCTVDGMAPRELTKLVTSGERQIPVDLM